MGGELLAQREGLLASQQHLNHRKVSLEEELRGLAAGPLPLLLAQRAIGLTVQRATSDRHGKQIELLRREAELRDAAIVNFLKTLVPQPQLSSHMDSYLEADRLQRYRAEKEDHPVPDGVLEQFSDIDLAGTERQLRVTLQALATCDEQLNAVERNLSAVPPDTLVAVVQQRLEQCRADRARTEALEALIDDELSTLRYRLDRLKGQADREAERLGEMLTRDEVSKRVISHSARARETLLAFQDALLKDNLHRLERTIQKRYQSLLRKKTLAHRITIDPLSFQISVSNDNGHLVSSHRLSAGERQLLAVATLWALAHESGRHLPTVIDTPLSRLDSRHRGALVRHYFPKASHQVILLSTDEEVVGRYQQELAPFVGKYYLIENDETTRTSRFVESYFRNEEGVETA
jgi:DNA sulfur modification protein DndD